MFRHVIEQHAELVTFLWPQRTELAADPATTIGNLNRFDLRLHANLEGLLLAGEAVSSVLARAWAREAPGVLFGRAVLAVSQGDAAALDAMVAMSDAASPLVSAIGFAEGARASQALSYLAEHTDAAARLIAARGLRALRQTAGLAALVADPERSVAVAAIEAAGLSRYDDDGVLRMLRGAAQAGDAAAIQALWVATAEPRYFGMLLEAPSAEPDEIALTGRLAPPEGLARWLATHRDRPGSRCLAIRLAGAAGFADDLGWLAATLDEPEHAKAGRGAIGMMLGSGFMAADAAQSSHACRAWLATLSGRFRAGERYLGGLPISNGSVASILRSGPQALRQPAAFEAARLISRTAVLNITSPAFRQLFQISIRF